MQASSTEHSTSHTNPHWDDWAKLLKGMDQKVQGEKGEQEIGDKLINSIQTLCKELLLLCIHCLFNL